MLRSVSFYMRGKRAMNVAKTDNTKGSALTEIIVKLLHRSDKSVIFRKGGLAGASSERTQREQRLVRVLFRGPTSSLGPQVGVGRSVRRPTEVRKVSVSCRGRVRRVVGHLRLERRLLRHCPRRLSKKRLRHMYLKQLLLLGPKLLVLSRPASVLSISIRTRVVKVLGRIRRRRGVSCLFVSRSLSLLHTYYRQVKVLGRKGLIRVRRARGLFRDPTTPCAGRLVSTFFAF